MSTEGMSQEGMEALQAHVARHFGAVQHVFHELLSDELHVDVLLVDPERGSPAIATMGMSGLPMPGAAEAGVPARLELVMRVEPRQPWPGADLKDERNYWPIRQLKGLARLPLRTGKPLAAGHTIASDPPEPFAPGVPFCALGLLEPLDPAARTLRLPDGTEVHFLQVVALQADELEAARANPGVALAEMFADEEDRVAAEDRGSRADDAPDEERDAALALYQRGRRVLGGCAAALAATAIADAACAGLDDAKIWWGRLCFTALLAVYLGEGRAWARWATIVLCGLGAIGGFAVLVRIGLPNWRAVALAGSAPVWAAIAVIVWWSEAVRFAVQVRKHLDAGKD